MAKDNQFYNELQADERHQKETTASMSLCLMSESAQEFGSQRASSYQSGNQSAA